jgi:hypothetical protein
MDLSGFGLSKMPRSVRWWRRVKRRRWRWKQLMTLMACLIGVARWCVLIGSISVGVGVMSVGRGGGEGAAKEPATRCPSGWLGGGSDGGRPAT